MKLPSDWNSGYGPWVDAAFDGECDGCDAPIEVGDRIRSDGEGGWLCEDCGGDDDD